jgi:PhzF family phenazine biosynthesis protein
MKEIFSVGVAYAFTNDKYNALGNPAGFVLQNQFPDATTMSVIAEKTNLPMTAFVVAKPGLSNNFDIRYYDQGGRECHICGHASIVATAHLMEICKGSTDFSFHLNPACFNGDAVTLKAHVQNGEISLDLIAGKLEFHTDDQILMEHLSRGLNIPATKILGAAFCTNIRDYVVEVESTDVLQSLKPDYSYLKNMAEHRPYQHEGMMVTARVHDEHSEFDIHSRAFLPITGVDEDVACGSANCSLIPYWHQRGLFSKTENNTYFGLFPYPPAGKGRCGGVQKIHYKPEKATITLYVGAMIAPPITVSIKDAFPAEKQGEAQN